MRLLKNGIKRLKTVVTYTTNQGVSDDDGVVELVDYLRHNPTMKVIANTSKDGHPIIAYEYTAYIEGTQVIITNGIGDVFYRYIASPTYIVGTIANETYNTSNGREVVLWENASPTSAFVAQTISINKSFSKLKVMFKFKYDANDYYICEVYDTNKPTICPSFNSVELVYRKLSNLGNIIDFSSGRQTYWTASTSGLTESNYASVPLKIIGVY